MPGLPNPHLVGELFRLYSQPWGLLARQHIKTVWETTNRFLELLLRYLTDDDVCEKVLRHWLYPIMEEKLNLAYSKLDELLQVHKDYPMTTNIHFIENSRARQQDNGRTQPEPTMRSRPKAAEHSVNTDELSQTLSGMRTGVDIDMDMVAAEVAFDNMNAYYEVWPTI